MRTHEAAEALGLHPLNLLLKLSALVEHVTDCWPSVDEGLIETVCAMDADLRESRGGSQKSDVLLPTAIVADTLHEGISSSAAIVIEKLWRKRHWGSSGVSWDTMRNHYCKGIQDLSEAIEELVSKEYLLSESRDGPFSLNPSHKGEIDLIAKKRIEH